MIRSTSVLVRIGVLHARAGDAHGAQEALGEAATLDEEDALSLELLGALATWAPDAVPLRAGADAYVRAAKRRNVAGDAVAELEEFIGKTIRFQPEEHYSQEQFDVVLL